MATLPRQVVLKSNYNGKYLQYNHEDGEVHGFLQFSGDEAVSKYTQFKIEQAKCGENFVHIKCCHNYAYWRRSAPEKNWIVAKADKPQEDDSEWSCTLFKLEPVEGSSGNHLTNVRFFHVQLGKYAYLNRDDPPPYRSSLFAWTEKPSEDLSDVVTVIDWKSLLLTLPKHIALRGDNGKYLSAQRIDGNLYLQFASDNFEDSTVRNEVFTNSNGSVRIKSDHFGMYWKRSPTNWICPDHSVHTTEENLDTVFWPVKVGNSVVALNNMGNNFCCKRLTAEGKADCLNAAGPTISNEAGLEFYKL